MTETTGAPPAPWVDSFDVAGSPGGHIPLAQFDRKQFVLGAAVTYTGARTGLEEYLSDDSLQDIRTVTPDQLPVTDLASVPGPLRWFIGNYGVHTPAALIHDRLIGNEEPIEGMTEQFADRYFRFMLEDVGVRWLRRWIMWAAVAFRTRSQSGVQNLLSLLAWVALSILGIVAFVSGVATGTWALVVLALIAPFGAAFLWGKQYGAGLVASYVAPVIGPPTIAVSLAYGVYVVAELFFRLFGQRDPGTEPLRYDTT